jgi:hypothetical protein
MRPRIFIHSTYIYADKLCLFVDFAVRILWLFVFLAFVSIGFTLISMYIVFVSKHPVLLITSAKKVKIQRILYPALTICAPNSFKLNQIRKAVRYVSNKIRKLFIYYGELMMIITFKYV